VQRHATFAVELAARHFGAAETTGALHSNTEGAGLLGVLNGSLHGPTKGHTTGKLIGDALRGDRRVEFGLLDLLNVQLHLGVARDAGQFSANAVSLAATAPDDDAGAGGVDVDAKAIARALDLDAADRRVGEVLVDEVADLPVLDDISGAGRNVFGCFIIAGCVDGGGCRGDARSDRIDSVFGFDSCGFLVALGGFLALGDTTAASLG